MSLPIFGNVGAALVETLCQGATVSFLHKDTGEVMDIVGFRKSKMQVKDPISGRTEYQEVPRYRLANVPWDELTLEGDEITDADGTKWQILRADNHTSGSTTAYVKQIRA